MRDRLERECLSSCGVRMTCTGKHFRFDDGTILTVIDEQGQNNGQAACFSGYRFLTE